MCRRRSLLDLSERLIQKQHPKAVAVMCASQQGLISVLRKHEKRTCSAALIDAFDKLGEVKVLSGFKEQSCLGD